MTDPTKTVTNPRIAKLIQYEGKLDAADQQELDTYRALGQAPKKANASLTEAQGKATGFYGRALEADENFTKTASATEPRGLLAQTAANLAPGIANTLSSPDRQLSEQAKRNFILASLRYESGASINADEFEKQDRAFFPQPGDGPEVIAQKAKDRQVVIEALKQGSGPGATSIATAASKADDPLADTKTKKAVSGDIGFATGELPKDFTPEQATAYDAFLKANPKPTPEQLTSFVHGMGFDLQNADKVIAGLQRGAGFVSGKDAVPEAAKPIDPGDGTLGAVARGAGDIVPGLSRATAAVSALRDGTKYSDELTRQQGYRAFDEENHFWPRLAGGIGGGVVGGFLLPGSEETTAASIAKTGAGMGALYGVSNSNDLTNIPDVIKNGVVGAATGAAAGYGLGKLSELYQGRGIPPAPPSGPSPTGNAVADAAARLPTPQPQGVIGRALGRPPEMGPLPLVAGDVAPGARGMTSLLESMPGARGPVSRRIAASNDAMAAHVDALGNGVSAGDRTDVGDMVQTGAQNWIKRSGDIARSLYDRAQQISGNAQVAPSGALKELDAHIADLSRTPATNKGKLEVLNAVRSDMVDAAGNPKPLDIDSVRQIRTNAREMMDEKSIRSSDLDRRLGLVKAAIGTDIASGLSSNPRALAAYNRADQFTSERLGRVDNVLQKLIGKNDDPISGEAVMATIDGMASPGRTGKAEKLSTLMSSLRPDEREQVAAHIAGSLGRASPDEDFSAARFLSQSRKLSPKARVALFGKNGAQAIGDLATIAEERVATIKDFNNSGSGRVRNYLSAIKGLLTSVSGGAGLGAIAGGGAGAATGGGVGLALGSAALAGGNITARVLTNPAVARALAQGLRATTVQAAQNSISRLGQIATSNPAIRTEVLGIQQKLAQAVNDNMPAITSAAASNGERPRDQQ